MDERPRRPRGPVTDQEVREACKRAPIAAHTVAKKCGHLELEDELESAAYEILAKAARHYDDQYEVPFGIFAWHSMYWGCIDAVRAWAGRPGHNRKMHASSVDDLLASWRLPTSASAEDMAMPLIEMQDLAGRINKLPHKQREALLASARGEPMHVVGSRLGVTESRVSQLRREALRLMGAPQIAATPALPVRAA